MNDIPDTNQYAGKATMLFSLRSDLTMSYIHGHIRKVLRKAWPRNAPAQKSPRNAEEFLPIPKLRLRFGMLCAIPKRPSSHGTYLMTFPRGHLRPRVNLTQVCMTIRWLAARRKKEAQRICNLQTLRKRCTIPDKAWEQWCKRSGHFHMTWVAS